MCVVLQLVAVDAATASAAVHEWLCEPYRDHRGEVRCEDDSYGNSRRVMALHPRWKSVAVASGVADVATSAGEQRMVRVFVAFFSEEEGGRREGEDELSPILSLSLFPNESVQKNSGYLLATLKVVLLPVQPRVFSRPLWTHTFSLCRLRRPLSKRLPSFPRNDLPLVGKRRPYTKRICILTERLYTRNNISRKYSHLLERPFSLDTLLSRNFSRNDRSLSCSPLRESE